MSRWSRDEFGRALVDELTQVFAGLVGGHVEMTPAGPRQPGPQWVAGIEVSGAATGSYAVVFDAASASAVTAGLMSIDGPAPGDAVIDTLAEICNQALAALAAKSVARGATVKLAGVHAAATDPLADADQEGYALVGDRMPVPLTFSVSGQIAWPAVEPVPVERPVSDADRLAVILDIDLPLTVRFGRTELPLKALTRLGPGSLIDLGRSPDDPVEVLVSNRVVARGEVVIVSGNYGIRILDVVSQQDRVRSLEA